MIHKKDQIGCSYLCYDLLANHPELTHASFTRHGGHSLGDFASLNTSFEVGDNPEAVKANINKIKKVLDLPCLLSGKQHHSDLVHTIESPSIPIPPCDALVTNLPNIGLLIKHADCQAALFYDPIKHVIAGAHAGWKGSVQMIYTKTIQAMKSRFGTNPKDLLVTVSPSLSPEASEFIHYKTELPEAFWKFQIKPAHFDFWGISTDELKTAGVLPHHIEIARVCTRSENDYFSYRREKTTGRLASVIMLRKI